MSDFRTSALALLQGQPLLAGLSEKDLEGLLPESPRETSFVPGQEVSGAENQGFLLITEGSARLLGGTPEDPVSLELLKPGALIGLDQLATGLPPDWVRASGPVKALILGESHLRSWLNEHPEVRVQLRN
jgi:CRP-like cAMP-binding protein